MKKGLTALGLLLGTLGGVLIVHRSTDGICTSGEPAFMPDCRDMEPFDALGFFTEGIEDGTHLFQVAYIRSASSFVAKNATVNMETQAFPDSEKGKMYYVSATEGSKAGNYRALALEEYDELVLNFKGFYDICWDYDCTGDVPWKKKEKKNRFFLRRSGGSHMSGTIASAEVLARGNVTVLTIFLYEGKPLLDEERVSLERAVGYVGEWFRTGAKTVAGDEILDMKIKFYAKLMPTQRGYNPCSSNSVKSMVSEIPETASYDITALLQITENSSKCPPHPSGNVIILSIRKDGLGVKSEVDTLVRSFAHEIAHVFGATDKYTGVKEWEAGMKVGCKFEPEMLGRDIMCHRVPEGEGEFFGYVNPPLEWLYIKGPTAKELGWYDGDGDGVIEVMDPCPLDGGNICATLEGG